jgi:hypothetical protein
MRQTSPFWVSNFGTWILGISQFAISNSESTPKARHPISAKGVSPGSVGISWQENPKIVTQNGNGRFPFWMVTHFNSVSSSKE